MYSSHLGNRSAKRIKFPGLLTSARLEQVEYISARFTIRKAIYMLDIPT
jgi:hypothetical protein